MNSFGFDWRVIAAILAVFLLVKWLRRKPRAESDDGDYQLRSALLSKAERSFYGVMCQAVGSRYAVFAKVRVADVLQPTKGQERQEWQKAFNRISAKHFDFVLCEPNSLGFHCAIELNDKSHNSSRRQQRDQFLRSACQSAGLRLVEVDARSSYAMQSLRDLIEEDPAEGARLSQPDAGVS